METIEKQTLIGTITGIVEEDCCKYLGIKYGTAKPFCYPTMYSYRTPYFANTFQDDCPQKRCYHDEGKQKNHFYFDEFRKDVNFKYSQDCLNLNIYTPKDKTYCPVILFVHGGSFTMGSSDEKQFDGTAYAKNGVVLVTINYRLNIFGFYSDENTSNLALHDIILAINWVKSNIASFGGDPNLITLMGQSAGAMMLQSLIINPTIKKDIQGAILLSGGGFTHGIYAPHSKTRANLFFNLIKQYLKVSTKEQLMDVPTETLFKTWEFFSKKHPIMSMLSTTIVYDGDLIQKKNYLAIPFVDQIPCLISTVKNDLPPKTYVVSSANFYAKHCKGNVWRYTFNSKLPGDNKGNWHSADLWYAFGTLKRSWRPFKESDYEISKKMIEMFCDFAKNQIPTNRSFFNLKFYPKDKPII